MLEWLKGLIAKVLTPFFAVALFLYFLFKPSTKEDKTEKTFEKEHATTEAKEKQVDEKSNDAVASFEQLDAQYRRSHGDEPH